MPRSSALVALVALVAALAGCNDDGRTLAPAPTVPVSEATTTTVGIAAPDPGGLTLTSPAFVDGGTLDASFTCDGQNVPPPLSVTGIPAGTTELAIVVTDEDAAGFVHWVVAGLPPTVTTIESGLVPPGAVTAITDSGVDGWDGPCPPPGDAPHRYDFSVYASAESIGLAPGLQGRKAIGIIEEAATTSDVLTATYGSPEEG